MSLPAGLKLEIELVPGGGYADVTADASAATIRYGRISEFSTAGPASFQVTLNNSLSCSTGEGSYTPGRQVLRDGTTAHPYYPNIVPRRRIRLSYTISGTQYWRFTGFVAAWQPTMISGWTPEVVVIAYDVSSQLSRLTLPHLVLCEARTDGMLGLWPMNEPAGYDAFADSTGNLQPLSDISDPTLVTVTAGAAGPMPVSDGWTGVTVEAINAGIGPLTLQSPLPTLAYNGVTVEAEFTITGATPTDGAFVTVGIIDAARTGISAPNRVAIKAHGDGSLISVDFWISGTTLWSAAIFDDGLPHYYALTATDNTGTNWQASIDFDVVSIITGATAPGTISTGVFEASVIWTSTIGAVTFGPLGLYQATGSAGLSGARVLNHYHATVGFPGEDSGFRIARYLGYAGVTNTNLDTGSATLSGYQPVNGQTVQDLCQQVAVTENGGAAFYVSPDGDVRFADRTFRDSTTPTLTVDAGADLDGGTFLPSIDANTLVNQCVVSRPVGGGNSSLTYTNAASVTAYGLTSSSVTSYADTDEDAMDVGEYVVASQSTPGYRLPQVAVDLLTATTTGLYASVAAVQIGSRLRVTSLDGAAAPQSQMDLIVEGWTETINFDAYTIVYDASPADNPPRAKAGTAKAHPVAGNMTLNTTITASATTVLIANSDGIAMTLDASAYPVVVHFGEEDISLPSAPSGSTSPQTFTGCTRGANNTVQAPHTAGAVLSLSKIYGKVQL